MMDCRTTQQRMSELLDGELSPDLRAQVERHLSACPACLARYQALRQAWEALGDVPAVEPSPGYVSRFWSKATLEAPHGGGAWIAQLWPWLRGGRFIPVATALSVMLIVGSLSLLQSGPNRSPLEPLAGEDLQLLENMDLAEHLDVVKDLDLIEDMDVIADLDRLNT